MYLLMLLPLRLLLVDFTAFHCLLAVSTGALAVLALMLAWFSCRAGLTKEQVLANVGDVYNRANLQQCKAKAN